MADLARPRRLATTRWTLVLAASGADSPDARTAWTLLCEHYWYPVYAFIRRTGRSDEDARDLTQAFFTRTLEKNVFASARRDRGRFRTFLLTCVRNFLANAHDRETTAKRGGGQPHVSIDVLRPDDGRAFEIAETLTPEDAYEHVWARATLAEAMAKLARLQAQASTDGGRRFAALRTLLTDDNAEPAGTVARDLDMTEGAVRVAVHRLRRQYGECLRETIAETVADPRQVNDELRHLLAVLSGH
jgi:DNA-directed RNA polymerase specialized sigma24 family protein